MIYHYVFSGESPYYLCGIYFGIGNRSIPGIYGDGIGGVLDNLVSRDCSLQYHNYLYQEGGGLSYGEFNSLKILIVGRDNILNHTITPPGIFIHGYLAVTWLPINGGSQTILNIIGIEIGQNIKQDVVLELEENVVYILLF